MMQVQCLTNLVDDSCKDSTLIMQLLRDNKLLRRHRQAYGLVDFPSKCVTQKARQSLIVNMYSLNLIYLAACKQAAHKLIFQEKEAKLPEVSCRRGQAAGPQVPHDSFRFLGGFSEVFSM